MGVLGMYLSDPVHQGHVCWLRKLQGKDDLSFTEARTMWNAWVDKSCLEIALFSKYFQARVSHLLKAWASFH